MFVCRHRQTDTHTHIYKCLDINVFHTDSTEIKTGRDQKEWNNREVQLTLYTKRTGEWEGQFWWFYHDKLACSPVFDMIQISEIQDKALSDPFSMPTEIIQICMLDANGII